MGRQKESCQVGDTEIFESEWKSLLHRGLVEVWIEKIWDLFFLLAEKEANSH